VNKVGRTMNKRKKIYLKKRFILLAHNLSLTQFFSLLNWPIRLCVDPVEPQEKRPLSSCDEPRATYNNEGVQQTCILTPRFAKVL